MRFSSCIRAAAALAVVSLSLLTGCGGGGLPDQPLSIADDAPKAYTTTYLGQHPEQLVQPEHLIVAQLDPATGNRTSVRLHVREPMTLSLGGPGEDGSITSIVIEDAAGHERLSHQHGHGVDSVTLEPGAHRVVFQAPAGAPSRHVYLKLADTPTQAARRAASTAPRVSASAVGVSAATAPATAAPQLGLGAALPFQCQACDFSGADLAGQDFSHEDLSSSVFGNTALTNAKFNDTFCPNCIFAPISPVIGGTVEFVDAVLTGAVFGESIHAFDFRGANMSSVQLLGVVSLSQFGTSSSGRTTDLSGSDLTQVRFLTNNVVQATNFSNATLNSLTFFRGDPLNWTGNRFDHLPGNPFGGYDFSNIDLSRSTFVGTSLAGANLSVASGVKLTPDTNLVGAVLSDGTRGVNLAGQNLSGFKGWAASDDGKTPGADLRSVNLSGADLYQADLTGANLSAASLVGADLAQSNLKSAILVGALLGVAPDSSAATAANLSEAYMPLADFTDADLRSVKFDDARIYGAVKFVRARLDSASMVGAMLAEADFSQATLTNAQFRQAVLVNAKFPGANLLNADFGKAYVEGASFVGTVSVTGANFTDASFSLAAGAWPFTETDGTPFNYAYATTQVGDVGTTARGVATCPSGEPGPCTGAKLQSTNVPYPPPPPPTTCILVGPDYDNCPIPD